MGFNIMAKELVRTRKAIKKFMLMKANIQAVSLKIQTLKSQNSMAQAMKGVTKAMMMMNKQKAARDPEDHARVREAVGDHGYEGGDDERRDGRRHGRRGR